jgi:tetratricopeptide (TPR) repeat protein
MFKSGLGFSFEATWAWSLHASCCEFMGDMERAAISQLQVNVHREKEFRDEIAIGHQLDLNHYGLGVYLKFAGRMDEAETSFGIAEQMFVAKTQEESEQQRWFGHYRLGLLHEARGDLEKAEAQFRESLLIKPTNDFGSHALGLGRVLFKRGIFEESEKLLRVAFDWISFGAEERYWLGKCLLARGRTFEAEKLLAGVAHDYPFSSEYAEALEECRLALELAKTPASEIDFRAFLEAGEFWLKPARWLFLRFLWPSKRKRLLEKLFANGSEWADSSYVLFTDFEVTDDDLDDTLARAVAVSRQIHLAPEMPVNLRTEKLNVLLDLEGQLLRAWVGKGQVGLVVTVDISTWAIYYAAGNRDAMFAAGVAINWFLDCSIALASHPKFRRLAPSEFSGVNALSNDANNWTTQSQFESDIEQILTGRLPAPPKAHRVSGHIRRLGEGSPSDAARENAPPYIRRHMSPDETWVRGHNRGGDTTGVQFLTRLQSYSSLADFLATAQRARPSRLS